MERREIHLPGPSGWPLILAVGIALALLGIIVHWALSVVGGVIAVWSMRGWLQEARAAYEMLPPGAETAAGVLLPKEYVQAILFQVPAEKMEEVMRPDGLLAALHAHESLLRQRQQRGFLAMLMIRSPNEEGPVQIVLETRWRDGDALADYEEGEQTVLKIVEAFDGVIAPGTLQVYDMEVLL